MNINLHGKVAIVTGAGAGLGRAHACALAQKGAKVIVNDLSQEAAEDVSSQICADGDEAIAFGCDVSNFTDVEEMAALACERWGKIDILINNAGILRDRTFAKMDLADFALVLNVHLMGAVNCTKAVWDGMRDRNFGRIVFTTSSSGLYGNFGQSNYGAAKMALVGLMQTLALEGERYNIRVNCLAPSAATAMTNDLYPSAALAGLGSELVSPAVVMLASDDAPSKRIFLAGAGNFEEANITMTRGVYLGDDPQAAELLLQSLEQVGSRDDEIVPANGGHQYNYEVERALEAARIPEALAS